MAKRRSSTKKRGRKVEQLITTRDRIVFDGRRPEFDPTAYATPAEREAYEEPMRRLRQRQRERAVFTPTPPIYEHPTRPFYRREGPQAPFPQPLAPGLQGYGASPAEHTNEGAHAAGEASEYAVRAANIADQGDCNTARRFLNAAHGFIGHAVAHSKSGGSVSNITMATDTVDRAERHYATRCPVKRRK